MQETLDGPGRQLPYWERRGPPKESRRISIHAHFDGKVIVPDEPVDLPRGQALLLEIKPVGPEGAPLAQSSLTWLAENAVDHAGIPADLSSQHDHYLYGSPKRKT